MKTITSILFSLTLLLTTGMLFAQSGEAYIEQVGSSNQAYIQQQHGNISFNVDKFSYIDILRNQGVEGLSNGAPLQEGDGVYNSSARSSAKIFQDNSENRALILQAGFGHTSIIDQNSSNNFATVLQEGDGNKATIEQKNGSNEAKIIQYGSALEAIIGQDGNNNDASILQDLRGNTDFTNFRVAEIYQKYDNNFATVEQYIPTEKSIVIKQDGTSSVPVRIKHGTGTP